MIHRSHYTSRERRQTCFHEAAHAVVFALGGTLVYRVAVAPEGRTDWTYTTSRGGMRSGLIGCCEPFDAPGGQYLQWDDDKWAYIVDRERWNSLCRALPKQHVGMHRQSLCAEICATLAGPVADCMFLGEEVEGFVPGNCTEQWHDEAVADAMSWLLPYRNEFEHLTQMTHPPVPI